MSENVEHLSENVQELIDKLGGVDVKDIKSQCEIPQCKNKIDPNARGRNLCKRHAHSR